MRNNNKDYTISTTFVGGLTVDTAYEQAKSRGQTLIDLFLAQENSNEKRVGDVFKNKVGLVKTGDEYAAPNQFAVSGYELFDLTPNLPLSKFFHQGIIPARVGGGFAETVSAMRLTYAMAKKRLAGGNTNEANVTDVTPGKITVPAYTFQFGIVQGTVDLLKSASVAYDVLGYKLEALRLAYQRELDYFGFTGNEGIAGITTSSPQFSPGLLNNPDVGSREVAFDWSEWDVHDATEEIIDVISHLRVINRYDDDLVPNTLLLPTEIFTLWAKPAVIGGVQQIGGAGIAMSIFDYIKDQVRNRTGIEIYIHELPYLNKEATVDTTTAGIVANGENGDGQIIFYRNSDKAFRMPITMPLIGGALNYSPTEFGYRQNFLAVVATPLFVYPTSIFRLYNNTGKARP